MSAISGLVEGSKEERVAESGVRKACQGLVSTVVRSI